MQTEYQIRRISKQKANVVKRSVNLREILLLNTSNGYLIVEPVDSELGDGPLLSSHEADYELQPVWYPGPKATLREARKRLGLETESPAGQLVSSGA